MLAPKITEFRVIGRRESTKLQRPRFHFQFAANLAQTHRVSYHPLLKFPLGKVSVRQGMMQKARIQTTRWQTVHSVLTASVLVLGGCAGGTWLERPLTADLPIDAPKSG